MMAHDSSDGEFTIEDFQTLRERVIVMKTNYQELLLDRDYLLEIGEMYHGALEEKESEMDQLTHDLVSTQDSWRAHKYPFKVKVQSRVAP
jgi:hypothetical protein